MLAGAAVVIALVPAFADPIDGEPELARIAILARNDVPFDSLGAGAIAGHVGGVVCITAPTSLSAAAEACISGFAPEVLIIAGGEAAISAVVATAAEAACGGCTIDRRGGTGRDETAGILAEVPTDYGYTRPILTSPGGSVQIVGNAYLGGTMNVDALTVQSTDVVTNLNADQLDGFSSGDFPRPPITVSGLGGLAADEVNDGVVTRLAFNGYDVWNAPNPTNAYFAGFGIESPRDANVSTGPLFPLVTDREYGKLTSLSICFELEDADDEVVGVSVFSLGTMIASSTDIDSPSATEPGCRDTNLDVSAPALETTQPLFVTISFDTDTGTNVLRWYGYRAIFEPYTDNPIIILPP